MTLSSAVIAAVTPGEGFGTVVRADRSRELQRLKEDGHGITEAKRNHIIESNLESIRTTQLYRTLLHEIGHWVDWCSSVEAPSSIGNDPNQSFERLDEIYDSKPSVEKEAFAHRYADELRGKLLADKSIPFDRILAAQSLASDGLQLNDFALS